MHHEQTLISTIVLGLVLAFILGALANRLRLPPIVGYLMAGIVIGPNTPGFIADQDLANQLAEIGVILLMFGVGLHFSLKDLLSVRALAIPGAIAQIAVATLLGLGLGLWMGWPMGAGLVFGLALSVASTVVMLKVLQDRRLIDTERGRIAVGWLIVEDLAMVLALVLVPALSTVLGGEGEVIHDPIQLFIEYQFRIDLGVAGVIGVTILKVAAFVVVMLVGGRRLIPFLLHSIAHSGSRELFRLSVLAIALGTAFGASVLFGVSLALGAFFAGMILAESELSARAANETLPLRDAFAVLFFVSVGMLFDPMILITAPLPVLGTLAIIILGKSIALYAIVVGFGRSPFTALTISASLAQIGEFSFILAGLGVALGIMPEAGQDLILAGALVSIILNPVVFWGSDQIRTLMETRQRRQAATAATAAPGSTTPGETAAAADAAPAEPDVAHANGAESPPTRVGDDGEIISQPTGLSHHVVIAGYGRVGSVIAEGIKTWELPYLVIEDADDRIALARERGVETVVGNAATPRTLALANLPEANAFLVAIPNAFEAGQAVEQARKLNPTLRIVARAHSDEEESYLRRLGADSVIMGEREIGLSMVGRLFSHDLPAGVATAASDAAGVTARKLVGDAGEKPVPGPDRSGGETLSGPLLVSPEAGPEAPPRPGTAPLLETPTQAPGSETTHAWAPADAPPAASPTEPADEPAVDGENRTAAPADR